MGEGQKSLADSKESIAKLKKVKVAFDKLYREQMDVGTAAGSGTTSKRDTQRVCNCSEDGETERGGDDVTRLRDC